MWLFSFTLHNVTYRRYAERRRPALLNINSQIKAAAVGQAPALSLGLWLSNNCTDANMWAVSWICVLAVTAPVESITAEIPVVETESVFRPCSIALMREISNCWALSGENPNVALLV